MIELITGISMLASTVSLHMSAAGIATGGTSTTESTAIEQTLDSAQANHSGSYRAHVKEYFKNDPILVDIARCESTFRQFKENGDVIRGRVNSKDVGIMQINEKYHLERSKKLGYDIYTVEGNLGYAKRIYEDQGAAPWSASQKCWAANDLAVNK
jgi:hypothetical protein